MLQLDMAAVEGIHLLLDLLLHVAHTARQHADFMALLRQGCNLVRFRESLDSWLIVLMGRVTARATSIASRDANGTHGCNQSDHQGAQCRFDGVPLPVAGQHPG